MLKAPDWHDDELKVKVWQSRSVQPPITGCRNGPLRQRPACQPSMDFPLRSLASCPLLLPSHCSLRGRSLCSCSYCPPATSKPLHRAEIAPVCIRRTQCRAFATPNSVHPPHPLSTTPNNAPSRRPTARVCCIQQHVSIAPNGPRLARCQP
jgi:hypothetical protein